MPADVRINRLTTEVNVTDASAMLTPQVLDRIVQAVTQHLEEKQKTERAAEQERSFGSMRSRS